MIYSRLYDSPAGRMMLGVVGGGGVCLCDWIDSRHFERNRRNAVSAFGEIVPGENAPDSERKALDEIARRLDGYFSGELNTFDLRLSPAGTTFQMRVWTALSAIPYGSTTTYGEVAQAVGRAEAVRAVAAAIGANPISIIIPCHRVVAKDGSLTGYAGGLHAKRLLLAVERISASAE